MSRVVHFAFRPAMRTACGAALVSAPNPASAYARDQWAPDVVFSRVGVTCPRCAAITGSDAAQDALAHPSAELLAAMSPPERQLGPQDAAAATSEAEYRATLARVRRLENLLGEVRS